MKTMSDEKLSKLLQYERHLAGIDALYSAKVEIEKLISKAETITEKCRIEYVEAREEDF